MQIKEEAGSRATRSQKAYPAETDIFLTKLGDIDITRKKVPKVAFFARIVGMETLYYNHLFVFSIGMWKS